MNLIERPTILAIRKNHALEHATLKVLGAKYPQRSFAGYSDHRGFWIVGKASSEDLRISVDEALARLKDGEHELAFHPNCGTNFVVMGAAAGIGAWLASLAAKPNWKNRFDRLPNMIMFSVLALILSQPYAHQIQIKYTTKSDVGSLRVKTIEDASTGRISAHRILTTEQPEE